MPQITAQNLSRNSKEIGRGISKRENYKTNPQFRSCYTHAHTHTHTHIYIYIYIITILILVFATIIITNHWMFRNLCTWEATIAQQIKRVSSWSYEHCKSEKCLLMFRKCGSYAVQKPWKLRCSPTYNIYLTEWLWKATCHFGRRIHNCDYM